MGELCSSCFFEKPTGAVCPACGYDPSRDAGKYPMALRAGTILNGRYIVGRVLGQGGFGITYVALDYQTRNRVAIKEYLPTDFAGRTQGTNAVQVHSENARENFNYGREQFLAEAKTLAEFIGSEHIVRIYSYFEEYGTAYLAMEYIDGVSLDKYMGEHGGKLSVDEANELLIPVMEALDWVHSKGIVHRDIAPDNIIITKDGTAKLIDFGAARYSTGEKSKSLDVILKHGFAPKEQYMRHGRQGPFTDVYAMAGTYYYAITGKIPPDAIERIDEDGIFPPSTLGVEIDGGTEDALLKAIEVSAPDRYQHMGEFAAALREARPKKKAPAPPVPPVQPIPSAPPVPLEEAPAEKRNVVFYCRDCGREYSEYKRVCTNCESENSIERIVLPEDDSETVYRAADKKPRTVNKKNIKLAAILVLAVLLLFTAGKRIRTQNGWSYDAGTKTLTVNYNGAMPSFRRATARPWDGYDIRKIVIRDSVTRIGDYAFAYCSGVSEVTIPSSVKKIGDYAFCYCQGLSGITIPDSVESIGNWTFSYCSKLTRVELPAKLESMGKYAFCYCTKLKKISIPGSLKHIGSWAFSYCSALTDASIENGVQRIGEYAFCYCTKLVTISLPDSIRRIDRWAFFACSMLKNIHIPSNVRTIGKEAFAGCA